MGQGVQSVCNLLNGGSGRKEHEYDTLMSGNAKAQRNTCIVRQVIALGMFGENDKDARIIWSDCHSGMEKESVK